MYALVVLWPFVGRYTLIRHTGFPFVMMRVAMVRTDPVSID